MKVCYRRIWLGFVPLPFVHTFLEVSDGRKVVRKGFYNKEGKSSMWRFLGSFWGFVSGKVESERAVGRGRVVTRDPRGIRKVLREIGSVRWTEYHALRKNCFHWRNAVLERAGIAVPKDSWFG